MLFALVVALAPVTLVWKPSATPTLTYAWGRSGLYGAIDADIKMTLTRHVLDDSKPDAVHIKETLVLVEQRIGHESQPFDKQHPLTESWQLTRKGDGTFVSYDQPKQSHWPDEVLIADPLIDFVYPPVPIEVGGTWTSLTTDAVSEQTSDFTYVGTEQVGKWKCLKLTVTMLAKANNNEGNGKISGSGTFWVDPEDGAIVKSDLQLNQHQVAAIRLHEVLTRVS